MSDGLKITKIAECMLKCLYPTPDPSPEVLNQP